MLYRIIFFSDWHLVSQLYKWYLKGQKTALVPISGKALSIIKARWNGAVTELEPPAGSSIAK